MFGTKGIVVNERVKTARPYLPHGIVYAKINRLEVQKASSTDSRKVIFHLEGPAINDPLFQGVDKAKGQVGRMQTGFMKQSKAYEEFQEQLCIIAAKLNLRKEVDEVTSDSFEDYVGSISKILSGKFLWWVIAAEEYAKGKTTLKLPKYGFVKADAEVDPATLVMTNGIGTEIRNAAGVVQLTFDPSKSYHFRPFVEPDTSFGLPGAAAVAGSSISYPPSGDDLDNVPFGKSLGVDDLPFPA